MVEVLGLASCHFRRKKIAGTFTRDGGGVFVGKPVSSKSFFPE